MDSWIESEKLITLVISGKIELSGMKYLLFFAILYEIYASCPNGTFPNVAKDKCYFIPKDSKQFILAEISCQSQSGNLASISNVFEFISSVLTCPFMSTS